VTSYVKNAIKEQVMRLEQANIWNLIKPLAPAFMGMALTVGCADSGTSPSTEDAAGAYAALSAQLQQCADEADTCNTMANGDPTQEAACDSAEKACKAKTDKQQTAARGKLENAAGGCYKGRKGHGHDEDGGVDEHAGREERHGCVEHHAPRGNPCLDSLLSCLDDKAGAGAGQDAAVKSCVADAHTCIMDSMPKGGHGPGPGHHAAGAGGEPTGPFEHAGTGGGHKPEHAGAGGGHAPLPAFGGAGGGHAPHMPAFGGAGGSHH
jgi:hypothetical protein